MKTYKITDPKGVIINGKRLKEGAIVRNLSPSHARGLLHFGQIELVKESAKEVTADKPKRGRKPKLKLEE